MRVCVYLVLLLVVCLLGGCSRDGETGLNPGDLPPAFSYPDLDGKTRSLEEFRGKVVLLNFWATWCEPCMTEMPGLERLYSRLKDKGLVVVAIGIDDKPPGMREAQRQMALDFPILVDENGSVKARYRLTGVPESFVLDRQGRINMILDPEDGQPVARVVGPRNWDTPAIYSQLSEILSRG